MKENNWQISHGKEADSEFARGRDLQPNFLNLCKAGWQLSGLNRSEGGNAERAPMDWGHLGSVGRETTRIEIEASNGALYSSRAILAPTSKVHQVRPDPYYVARYI